jgi:dimethylglycine dehydrogenase
MWFAESPERASELASYKRTNAFERIGEETRAVRERAGLWETSSYCKIEVSGPGAADWLETLVANRIPAAAGRVRLCPMLTPRGRILGDVTVARLTPDRLMLFGSPAAEDVYLRWLLRHRPENVAVTSRTNELCGFSLTGPLAREVLSRVTSDDISAASFPFLGVRDITVGLARVLALRISFTGELGFELYMAPTYQLHVYRALMRAGASDGVRLFGARALNSLRLEKGYGGWGRELTQDYTAIEAGLQHFVRPDKPAFVGQQALIEQLASRPQRVLRLLAIASQDPDPFGGEPVFLEGEPIGRLTSAAFGYTVGHALGLAYLPGDAQGELRVEIQSEQVRAHILNAPPYDPSGSRLRG